MKTVTVREAESHLAQLIAEAHRGTAIVLTDGGRSVALEPMLTDLEADSPELAGALLPAVQGVHTPFREQDLRTLADRARRAHRSRPAP